MSDTTIWVALVVALLIVLVAAGRVAWQWWNDANTHAIAEAARRLVEAAEQQFREPKSGSIKFAWVTGRLQRRFPGVDWDRLAEYVEQAVLHLNTARAASATYRHRTGSHHDEQ
ncbi:MAG: hypothetical protein E6Q97_14255 [Desulfurellales bacterium]|nr:MAG: hypothetical protein E6Q97_14255 [Desulfurellales bacterium]